MKHLSIDTEKRAPDEIIARALSGVREHLGMEVAYLSEIEGNSSIFRAVDAPGLDHLVKPGDRHSLDDVYCRHIVEGRLPSVIADTSQIPLTASMPITTQIPIGSHVSVPIRRTDGTVFGMFCCLSPTPNPSLNDRDLAVMEMFAGLCADQINDGLEHKRRHDATTADIRMFLDRQEYDVVYQPIFRLGSDIPSGFEALCRFRPEPYRGPDIWFSAAETVGLAIDLELAVIKVALNGLKHLPDDIYLSVNASPVTAASGRLGEVLSGHSTDRIVLEITEHRAIDDPAALCAELRGWRDRGLQLAIDDAGAGYSGLQQIIQLRPDIVKLDMSLTSGIDADSAKRSLAAAMVHFAQEEDAIIVAEGIETAAELETLRTIGVQRGQGWHLGRPGSLCEIQARYFPDLARSQSATGTATRR